MPSGGLAIQTIPEVSEPTGASASGGLMTVLEVGNLLRCSPRTVYRLADAGRMPPPCRLGALVRWNRGAIDAWIAAGCPACRREGRR